MDGEVIGEAPLRFVGGVFGRPETRVGDPGEAGRRKGDERGELKVDLYDYFASVRTQDTQTIAVEYGYHDFDLPYCRLSSWLFGV